MTLVTALPASLRSLAAPVLFGVLVLGFLAPRLAFGQASVQIIHNAADPVLSTVDLYLQDADSDVTKIEDVDFREATAYLEVPAGTYTIAIADGASSDISEALKTFTVTFDDAESYVVVANGVLNRNDFASNPDTRDITLRLLLEEEAREASTDADEVQFLVVHGVTDAPRVNVRSGGRSLISGPFSYRDIRGYVELPADTYDVDITTADGETVLFSYTVDLSGLAGQTAVVLASGFLTPADNQNGPGLALIGVLPDGTVVTFPVREPEPMAGVQIIHNAPDPAAATVDLYLEDANDTVTKIEDLSFREATAYLDVPPGTYSVAVAGAGSMDITEALQTFDGVVLEANESYVVVATGVLDPSAFSDNPDGISTAFDLVVKADTRETADDPTQIDLFAVHGVTDAPTVNVRSGGTSLSGGPLTYKDTGSYVSLDADTYDVDVTTADGATVLYRYTVDLSGLAGQSAVALASGFATPDDDQDGPAFALIGALPDGTVVTFPVREAPTEAQLQIIHAAPDFGMVDIYASGALLVDDLDFREATAFTAVQAGTYTIAIAPGTSDDEGEGGVDDAVATFDDVELEAGVAYLAMALNEEDGDTDDDAVDLALKANVLTAAAGADVDVQVAHASPDAPEIDVLNVDFVTNAVLYEELVYGEISEYASVGPAVYRLGITPTGLGFDSVVEVVEADLQVLGGAALTVVATGFLTPEDDQPAFAVIAYDASGTALVLAVVTDTEEEGERPAAFALGSNYPNPFSAATRVAFDLPSAAEVTVEVFDQLGRRVLEVPAQPLPAGAQRTVEVSGTGLPSGLYLYRVTARMAQQTAIATGSMTLIR